MAERVGVYVCHCGSNIAGRVDVEEVAKWAGEHIEGCGRCARLQVHVLGPRPETGRGGHQEGRAHTRGRRGGVQSAPAREDLSTGLLQRRSESLPAGNDQHPRALLVGAQGSGGGHDQGQVAGVGGGGTGQVPGTARADVRRRQSGHAGRGRRHRGSAGHAGAGRRRTQGGAGGTTAVDRRAHGAVRQDVSHARLLRLHSDAEDVGSGPARERPAADLRRTGGSLGFGGQFQGEDPPESAEGRLRPVHRLRRLRGEVPAQGAWTPSSRRAWARARRSTCRSRKRCPACRSWTPSPASGSSGSAAVPARNCARPTRSSSTRKTR